MKTIIDVLVAIVTALYMKKIIGFDYGKQLIEKLHAEYKKQCKEEQS